jgi:hydrogenase maturation factor HypF (carbamoyltransferase family)
VFNFRKFSLLKKTSCTFCGEKFSTLESLMSHFQTMHDNHIYECKKCNMDFEGMEMMRDHIRKYHSYKKPHYLI